MTTPRLILLLPALLGGCLERDIAAAAMHFSGTSSSSTGTTAASDSTTDPAVHSVTGRESSSTDTDTSTSELTDTGTSEPTASSTGEPTADPSVCGDGVIAGDEECDAPEDREEVTCTMDCARPRLAFLTSETFSGEDIKGLEGADTRCRLAAADAGRPDYLNFKAILSDSTTSAAERLHHGRGPYRLINGLQIARDFDALMNEPLENFFDTTELGTDGYNGAWTGTAPGGEAVAGSGHCEDWHSGSLQVQGSWGSPTELDGQWLEVANELVNPSGCVDSLALYCLEQE
jgi:hypothetical protein